MWSKMLQKKHVGFARYRTTLKHKMSCYCNLPVPSYTLFMKYISMELYEQSGGLVDGHLPQLLGMLSEKRIANRQTTNFMFSLTTSINLLLPSRPPTWQFQPQNQFTDMFTISPLLAVLNTVPFILTPLSLGLLGEEWNRYRLTCRKASALLVIFLLARSY